MTTIVEKDSVVSAVLLVCAACLFFAGGGVGLAYMTGLIGEKTMATSPEVAAPTADPTSAVESSPSTASSR